MDSGFSTGIPPPMAAPFCSAVPPRPKKATTPLLLPSLPPNYRPSPLAGHEAMVSDFDLFWRSVVNFHYQIGTQFTVGAVGKRTLDLHRLYCEVTKRDGYHKVTGHRKWKEVAVALQVGSTSISTVLKKEYIHSLYLFERVHFKTTGADPAVVQPAANDSQPAPPVQPVPAVIQVQTCQPPIQAMRPVRQVSAAAPAPRFQAAPVMPVPAVSPAASATPFQAMPPVRQVSAAAPAPRFQAAPVMLVPAVSPAASATPFQAMPPVRQVSAAAPAPRFQAAPVMPVPAVSPAASATPFQAMPPVRQVSAAAPAPPFQAAPVMPVPAVSPAASATPIQAMIRQVQPVPAVIQVQTGQPPFQAMPPVRQVSAAAPAPQFQAVPVMPVLAFSPAAQPAASAAPIQAMPLRQVQPVAATFQPDSVAPPAQALPAAFPADNSDRKKRKRRSTKKPSGFPKRARTGYNFFLQEKHASVRAQFPNKKPTELVSLIALAWNRLSPVDRTAYQRAEFEDKVRHQKEREEYQKKTKTAAKSGTQPVTGRVEAEFTGGYFISVQVGSETLKGVIFHSTATVAPPAATMDPPSATVAQPAATVAQPDFAAMMELATAAAAQADQAQIPASSSG